MTRKYRSLLLMTLFTAWTLALCACGESRSTDNANASATAARPVPTARIVAMPQSSQREFPATVQAQRRVDLSFSVDGRLMLLHGEAGRVVRKGEVIARLDPRDYQNALNAAQASYDEALQNVKRSRALFQKHVTAQAELDTAEAAYETTKAQVRIRRKALDDTVMRAPFDGVVSTRHVENHEYVGPNNPVLSLRSVTNLEVAFQVPERIISQWGKAALHSVQVRFEVGGAPWANATVSEVNAEADATTRTYKVVATLGLPEGITLLPGMTATARLQLPAGENQGGSVLAPLPAVFSGSDGASYVWIIPEPSGQPVRTRVTLGGLREDGVEIVSGLAPGVLVATAGVHSLDGTMPVRPVVEGVKGLE
ncbi:MAG: efflux RND transporter periplasmic adaptor subunit [Desulfovibrionaceae bacterium]